MNWDKAIKECPSNVNNKCVVLQGNKCCSDAVISEECPIKQLEKKSNHSNKSN